MADSKPSDEPRSSQSPDDALPPVQPPSGTFVLQLFFIPLLIVGLIVCVWILFSWLAHVGSDPQDLVRDLRRLNDSSWQKALNLANLLRNPEYDKVKDNSDLCREIASVLETEITEGKTDEKRLQLRIFLCRALGEFRVFDGVPALNRAATTERDPSEVNVRAAAVEAFAVLADKASADELRTNEKVLEALDAAATSRSDVADLKPLHDELRSRAAFALGVIGGERALNRLEHMLDDSYNNVRYNAATGLARQGDYRATAELLMMLKPKSDELVKAEKAAKEKNGPSKKAIELLRAQMLRVQNAALEAVAQLAKKSPQGDPVKLVELRSAVEKLAQESSGHIHSKAKEVALLLKGE